MLETFVLQRRWHKCKQDAPLLKWGWFPPRGLHFQPLLPGLLASSTHLKNYSFSNLFLFFWKQQLESSLSNRVITMLRDYWGCLKTGFCPADRRALQESTDPQNASSVCSFLQWVCAIEAVHFCTCVTHPLSTTQEKTQHMDITRWSTPKSDWLHSLQPKMEKLYTVSKNKTGRWLWLKSWIPYCQIQT